MDSATSLFEVEAKNWVRNHPKLQARYADTPEVWANILADIEVSLETYTQLQPNVLAALALLDE